MNFSYKIKQFNAYIKLVLRKFSYFFEYLFWLIFSFNKFKSFPKEVSKILIINYGAIGDVFSSMKTTYNLALSNKNIDFFILVDDKSYKEIKILEKYLNFRILSEKDIKKNKFDVTIIFNPSEHIKKYLDRLGFIVGNEYHSLIASLKSFNKLYLNRKIPPLWRHKMDQEMEIAKLAKIKINEPLRAVSKINNSNVKNSLNKKIKRFAIIHPSGRNFAQLIQQEKIPAMAWPLGRFAKIADYIIEKYKLDVIITGSKEESFIGEKVISYMKNKNNVINMSGKYSIAELPSLLSLSSLVISIDTSAVHIAEFVGTPVIVLFGPTFPEEIGAYGNPKTQSNLCHPEMCIRDRKKGASYDNSNICMSSISIEEVKNAIDRLMK